MKFQCILFATLGVLTSRYEEVFGLVSQTMFVFDGSENTYFDLYTPKSQDKPFVMNLNNASSITLYQDYDATLPMKVLIPGWFYDSATAQKFFQKFFECGQVNLVHVNWLKGSDTYATMLASLNVRAAGKAVASFLALLEAHTRLDMNKVDIVAAGLGAGVAGEAGSRIGNVSSILALDPSWTIYSRSLNRNDANYVQVVHSNAILGTNWRVGDADFYLNGLVRQPGCSFYDLKCSHLYASEEYYNSLCTSRITGCRKGHEGDCGYALGGFTLHVYSGEFDVTTTN